MANLLYQQIEMLSREKHIEPEVVVSAIEDAMVVAARKFYKTEEDLRGKLNPETGQVDVYSVLTVVEEVTDPKKEITLAEAKKKNPSAEVGTEILTPKPTDVLGRIAAQTAKQVILQKVREAERDTIFNEYNGRVGELVTVIVKRAEGPDDGLLGEGPGLTLEDDGRRPWHEPSVADPRRPIVRGSRWPAFSLERTGSSPTDRRSRSTGPIRPAPRSNRRRLPQAEAVDRRPARTRIVQERAGSPNPVRCGEKAAALARGSD